MSLRSVSVSPMTRPIRCQLKNTAGLDLSSLNKTNILSPSLSIKYSLYLFKVQTNKQTLYIYETDTDCLPSQVRENPYQVGAILIRGSPYQRKSLSGPLIREIYICKGALPKSSAQFYKRHHSTTQWPAKQRVPNSNEILKAIK